MSNPVRALLAVVILILITAVSLVIDTFPHWWLRTGIAEARSPTGHVYQADVYKSTKGDLLFVIKQDSLIDEYIFYPTTSQIGIPSSSQFFVSPLLAYSKDVPAPVVLSTNKIKVEMDMNIVVDGKRVEFTTLDNLRVRADTNDL